MNKLFWLFCIVYVFYLASITQTILYYDAFGYQEYARLIFSKGWHGYWSSALTREPIYPWFVSWTMGLAKQLGMDYIPILLVAQTLVLLLTVYLLQQLLKILKVSNIISFAILLYAIFSPAIIYTTFIEWSEIVTYPLVLGIVFASTKAWGYVQQTGANRLKSFAWGAVLACALLSLTFVKAVVEIVSLLFIIPWGLLILIYWTKQKAKAFLIIFVLLGFMSVFWAGVSAYKAVNWHYQGQFVLTDRGSWALYGNTARRMAKLTPRQWQAAILSVPTNGPECHQFLKPPDECAYWTFVPSDQLGQEARDHLKAQGNSDSQVNSLLVKKSLGKMLENIPQAATLMFLEGMKFMFWEFNAKPEYALYPMWLTDLYRQPVLYVILHYGVALLTLISLMAAIRKLFKNRKILITPQDTYFQATVALFFTCFFVLCFIFAYSFFFCSGRYAMPLAPLFLALIADFFNKTHHQRLP